MLFSRGAFKFLCRIQDTETILSTSWLWNPSDSLHYLQSQFPGANEVVGDEIWEPGVRISPRFKVRSCNRHSHGDTPLFHGGTAKGNQNSGRLPERGAGIGSEVTHWASEEQPVALRTL